MVESPRAYAWLWIRTGFKGARDSLGRAGVWFAVLVASVSGAYWWWRGARLPFSVFWNEWPWNYGGRSVNVVAVVVAPLVVIVACCLLYLVAHLLAAPYRMQHPQPTAGDPPPHPQVINNFFQLGSPKVDHAVPGVSATGKVQLWLPSSVAKPSATKQDEPGED